jgi:choline dehydrogenase-like flavoprotein
MILDALDPTCPRTLNCEICVIGAGAAGAYLAHRCSASGRDVVVLEAGGRQVVSGVEAGFTAEESGSRYGGVHEGRGFGFGGTSALWGGVLIPYGAVDSSQTPGVDRGVWRHIVNVVENSTAKVRNILGVRGLADYDTRAERFLGALHGALDDLGIATRTSEMLPFRSRNLARLLSTGCGARAARVVLHAVAKEWSLLDTPAGGSVQAVRAVTELGMQVEVRARVFVIAAGAVESARILLEMAARPAGRRPLGGGEVGQGISDHLSVRIAGVVPADVPLAIECFGFRFDGCILRSIRMIDRHALASWPKHFAHVLFNLGHPGLAVARKVLASLQARTLPRVTPAEALLGATGLSTLAFHKMVRRRLFIPQSTNVSLQLDVEQLPAATNRVTLGAECDRYGRLRPRVHWEVSGRDWAAISAIRASFLSKWEALGRRVPRIDPVALGSADAKPHDAYHPVGGCRMGDDDSAVVTRELLVSGTTNLHVLSTAVFPSAGTANPTLSLLCMGEMLATHLIATARSA